MLEHLGGWLNGIGVALTLLLALPLIALIGGLFGKRSGILAAVLRGGASAADRINSSVASVVIWFALAMALVQFAVVILRYVFGLSFLWLQESVTYFHGALFLLAAGYALKSDAHVRVDIFYREASPKYKAIVNLVGVYLFLIPMCLLAIWMAGPYVAASWAVREGSHEASGIQAVFLLKSLIPAFAALLLIQSYSLSARAALALTGAAAGGATGKQTGAQTGEEADANPGEARG